MPLANFPRVKVVTVEDAGHNIWTDDPDNFNPELNQVIIKNKENQKNLAVLNEFQYNSNKNLESHKNKYIYK